MKYLNEDSLGLFLKLIYPNYNFIHDKSVPYSPNKRYRPDYRNEELKIIVEFDGYNHYTQAKRILTDDIKDEDYKSMGYTIIRIPYFVQMNSSVIKHLFNVNLEIEQQYPHGFIDKKVVYPSDFCELGIKRFLYDLERFDFIKEDIIESLKNKSNKNFLEIIPESLAYLINN